MARSNFIKHGLVIFALVLLIGIMQSSVAFAEESTSRQSLSNNSEKALREFGPSWVIHSVFDPANFLRNNNHSQLNSDLESKQTTASLSDKAEPVPLQKKTSSRGSSQNSNKPEKIVNIDDPNFIDAETADSMMSDVVSKGVITIHLADNGYTVNIWHEENKAFFNIRDNTGNLVGGERYKFSSAGNPWFGFDDPEADTFFEEYFGYRTYISDVEDAGDGKFAVLVKTFKYEFFEGIYSYRETVSRQVYDTTAESPDTLTQVDSYSGFSQYNTEDGLYACSRSNITLKDYDGGFNPADFTLTDAQMVTYVIETNMGDGMPRSERRFATYAYSSRNPDDANLNFYGFNPDITLVNFESRDTTIIEHSSADASEGQISFKDSPVSKQGANQVTAKTGAGDEALNFQDDNKTSADDIEEAILDSNAAKENDLIDLSKDKTGFQQSKDNALAAGNKAPDKTKEGILDKAAGDANGKPLRAVQDLENIVTNLAGKDKVTDTELYAMQAAKAVLDDEKYVDEKTMREFEDAIKLIIASESSKESLGPAYVDFMKKAFKELLDAKEGAAEEFEKNASTYYNTLLAALTDNLQIWLEKSEVIMLDKLKGNKHKAVEYVIARLKENSANRPKETDAILKLEARLNKDCLAPSSQIYSSKLQSAMKQFSDKVNSKLRSVKNASMEETPSEVRALFVLPQK